jgi:hypothetical protein
MPRYLYILKSNGSSERLGNMVLLDDMDAIVFGKQLVRDLAGQDKLGGALAIIRGKRTVSSIPIK